MSNELAKTDINTMLAQDAGTTLCSIQVPEGDRETAAKVFNALNNPEFKVADFINKEIVVKDILIEAADIVNEETGEVSRVPRVVLIDPDGKAYQAVSMGMFNVIKNACKVAGPAPWDPPITFRIKQRNVKNGSMLTADMVF